MWSHWRQTIWVRAFSFFLITNFGIFFLKAKFFIFTKPTKKMAVKMFSVVASFWKNKLKSSNAAKWGLMCWIVFDWSIWYACFPTNSWFGCLKHVREKGKKVKYWIWVIYLFLYFMFVILFGTLEKVKSLLINGYYSYFGQLGEKPTTTFSTRSQFSFFSKSEGKKIDVKFWRLFKYGFHPQTTFGISLFILSIFWRFKKQWRKEKWIWISISLVWLL